MATKAKPKKATAKKAAPRKRKAAAKPKAATTPAVSVRPGLFAPGATVGFYPASAVGVERGIGSAPMANPTETAKVAKDGSLKVHGLGKGQWLAAAEVGERWRYLQFSVK